MATYAIGDIQGCYDELINLLEVINFDQERDQLWFVGDLVNRGPKSLEVLRFVYQLKNSIVVLGNHDLHLLAIYHGKDPLVKKHTLASVLQAEDAKELIEWLRMQPLLHYDAAFNAILTHAGVYPLWSLTDAQKYAAEVETVLQSNSYVDFLAHMYGNEPDIWSDALCGNGRLRFILNSFVRMRFCDKQGHLDFVETGPEAVAPAGYLPWFKMPKRKVTAEKIIFGHWAALQGKVDEPNIYALDTGCVWGGTLTAIRIDDNKKFSVACSSWRNLEEDAGECS